MMHVFSLPKGVRFFLLFLETECYVRKKKMNINTTSLTGRLFVSLLVRGVGSMSRFQSYEYVPRIKNYEYVS
jgi:hypothetical protein